MIPVTGAGWSQVSGVGGVTEGASATATEDRIVVLRALADGAAGASIEPGSTHGQSKPLGLIAAAGDREDRAPAAGQVPVDASDDLPSSQQSVSQSRVGPAGRRLERTPQQLGLERLPKAEEPREPLRATVVTDLVRSNGRVGVGCGTRGRRGDREMKSGDPDRLEAIAAAAHALRR